jgi:hypothetical protein
MKLRLVIFKVVTSYNTDMCSENIMSTSGHANVYAVASNRTESVLVFLFLFREFLIFCAHTHAQTHSD